MASRIRINTEIPDDLEVSVIGPDGALLGLMRAGIALKLAHKSGLDLVEVGPERRPPACKIIDFARFKAVSRFPGRVERLRQPAFIDIWDASLNEAELRALRDGLECALDGLRALGPESPAESRLEVLRSLVGALADLYSRLEPRHRGHLRDHVLLIGDAAELPPEGVRDLLGDFRW